MRNYLNNFIFTFLLFCVLLLGVSTTSSAVSIGPIEHDMALSIAKDFSLFNENSGSKAVPHNPFSDCTLKNDCSPHKHLNTSISTPPLIINTEREISSLHDYSQIISDTRHKPKDTTPILHSPPPKS